MRTRPVKLSRYDGARVEIPAYDTATPGLVVHRHYRITVDPPRLLGRNEWRVTHELSGKLVSPRSFGSRAEALHFAALLGQEAVRWDQTVAEHSPWESPRPRRGTRHYRAYQRALDAMGLS